MMIYFIGVEVLLLYALKCTPSQYANIISCYHDYFQQMKIDAILNMFPANISFFTALCLDSTVEDPWENPNNYGDIECCTTAAGTAQL